jgi:hypothetical protein
VLFVVKNMVRRGEKWQFVLAPAARTPPAVYDIATGNEIRRTWFNFV